MTPNKFNAVFTAMMEQAQQHVMFESINKSRLLDVHPSQIPICPLSFVLNFDVDCIRQTRMVSDCILKQGTTIHAVVQKYLSADARLYGCWACPECGQYFSDLSTVHNCPDCGCQLTYSEIPINYKGFAGHVDCVVKIDDEFWLVDFKTSSYNSIATKVKTTPVEYDLQTLAYCLLLRLQYGLKIKGRAICYINRDNPQYFALGGTKVITKKDLKTTQQLLKDQRELLNFLLDCKSYKEFMSGVGIQHCSNPYCKVCTNENSQIKVALKQKFKQLKGKCIREYVQGVQ